MKNLNKDVYGSIISVIVQFLKINFIGINLFSFPMMPTSSKVKVYFF